MTSDADTKELAELDKRGEIDPGASDGVYAEFFDELASDQGVRTRAVFDVISGTSAGGINGVYLAKALAHNRSQDSLRDLWFQRGDVNQLLIGPASSRGGSGSPHSCRSR